MALPHAPGNKLLECVRRMWRVRPLSLEKLHDGSFKKLNCSIFMRLNLRSFVFCSSEAAPDRPHSVTGAEFVPLHIILTVICGTSSHQFDAPCRNESSSLSAVLAPLGELITLYKSPACPRARQSCCQQPKISQNPGNSGRGSTQLDEG